VADRRIRVPKRHEEFVQRLTRTSTTTGPFETQADVIAFAAAWGAHHGEWSDIEAGNRDPIRPEVFTRGGYDTLIHLLAFHKAKDVKVLANSSEMEEARAEAFEGYAQSGLDLLATRLRSEVDYTEAILTLAKVEAKKDVSEIGDVDIRLLLSD